MRTSGCVGTTGNTGITEFIGFIGLLTSGSWLGAADLAGVSLEVPGILSSSDVRIVGPGSSLRGMGSWASGQEVAESAEFGSDREVAALTLDCRELPSDGDLAGKACPEVRVRIPVPRSGVYAVRARGHSTVPFLEGARLETWLPHEREGDAIVVRVPVARYVPRVDLRVLTVDTPHPTSIDDPDDHGVPDAHGVPGDHGVPDDHVALIADPLDSAPLGNRDAVILVHGFNAIESLAPFDPDKDQSFETLRGLPEYRRGFSRFKFYRLTYRPWRAFPDLATWSVDRIEEEMGEAPGRIHFLAHSAGGLLARYAAADSRIQGRIGTILTLATPHHGAITSSMMYAHSGVARRIGILYYLLLVYAKKDRPPSPAMTSLAYDDFDRTIGPEGVASGLITNPSLARFNAIDPNKGRIIAYQGIVTHLWGRGDLGITSELYRRALAAFEPTWASADPIVHIPSGTFAGHAIARTRVFRRRAHEELLHDPAVLRSALLDLYQGSRRSRARSWWARFARLFR